MKKYLALLLVKAQTQEDFLQLKEIARDLLVAEAIKLKHEQFLHDKELQDLNSIAGYNYVVRAEVAKWVKI